MDIISLIIIIVVIKKIIKKDKEKNQNRQRRNIINDVLRQCRDDYTDAVARQRATKERLEKKYAVTQRQMPYTQSATKKPDILTRAKANVKEEEPDTFKQQAHAQVCAEYRSHAEMAPDLQKHKDHSLECDFENESDILKRVNDLIVMGYDGNMEFDRDFVAEGVEMLNRFSL